MKASKKYLRYTSPIADTYVLPTPADEVVISVPAGTHVEFGNLASGCRTGRVTAAPAA